MTTTAPAQYLTLIGPAGLANDGVVIETNAGPIRLGLQSGQVTLRNQGIVVSPQSLPATWIKFSPDNLQTGTNGGEGVAKQFVLGNSVSDNLTGDPSVIHVIGWNINSAGVRVDSTDGASYLAMEQQYEYDPNVTTHKIENHWQGYDIDGTAYRFLSQSFVRGQLATTSQLNLKAQNVFFQTEAGLSLVVYDFGNKAIDFMLPTSSDVFEIAEGSNYSAKTGGIFRFVPYAVNTSHIIQFGFSGGGGQFYMTENGGTPTSLWLIGPAAGSTGADAIWIRNGKGLGIGVDPGSGSVAGQLVIKDGGKITASGTATGMYFGASGDKLAFYAGTPQAKLTVTGAKGGNAALSSLMTQLAAIGLFVDGTS